MTDPAGTEPTEETVLTLVDEVRSLTDEVQKEKRFRNIVSGLLAGFVALSLACSVAGFLFVRHVNDVADDDRDRSLGLLVAICAIQNVGRIEFKNFVTDLERSGLLVEDPGDQAKADEFYATARRRFGNVDCRAFVPQKDQVKIELQYPDEETVEGGPTFGPGNSQKG